MNKFSNKCFNFLIIIIFFTSVLFASEEKKFTIVHTNDLHSHLLGFSPNMDYTPAKVNDDLTLGGWARISTVIKDVKSSRENSVLVLDAGDFLMGSLFHLISRKYALELKLMKAMGYDAVTLGNHEFDLNPKGLAKIINSGIKDGGIPTLVSSNLIFSKDSEKDDSLEACFKAGYIKPYHVIKKDGIKFGFFGLIGDDAAEVAPFASPVKFADTIKTANTYVSLLKNQEKVDVVICLSHSGLSSDMEKSEDVKLAKQVKGIDIIISGHTHTKLPEPLIINDTIIVQAWEYGKELGILDLKLSKGKVVFEKYEIVKIDDSIKGDPKIISTINIYKGAVNMNVLKYHGLGFDAVVAETDFDLIIENDESNLGNLLTDSILWYVNKYDYDASDPLTKAVVGVISGGVIRDNVLKGKTGKVAVSDLFKAIPLGIGMDDSMAYPLISIYLHPYEIKRAAEILTSIYPLKGDDYFLQISGLKFKYNPNRVIFDRVTEIFIGNEEQGYKELDYSKSNKDLHRIVADIYNATFIKIVGSFTMGFLEMIPKDKQGNIIDDLVANRVDMDKEKEGIQEMKEWLAVMEYVKSFEDTDGNGISNIPQKYKGKLGRIVKEASWSPVSLLKNGTYLTWIAFSVFVVLFSLFVLILKFVYSKFIIKEIKK